MTQTLEVIYEDNVLKPLTPINGLQEHQQIEVIIDIPQQFDQSNKKNDASFFYQMASEGLEKAYGEHEPEYSLSMIREPNAEYKP